MLYPRFMVPFASMTLILALAGPASAQQIAAKTAVDQPGTSSKEATHKVAIQVSDNDPKLMNLALNNAKNVVDYYRDSGETVAVEIVTYGPGLHMFRADSSPVKQRVAEMSLAVPEVSFAACGNTQTNMAKQEGKEIAILSEARLVSSGVVRLMELQKQGYAYIRP